MIFSEILLQNLAQFGEFVPKCVKSVQKLKFFILSQTELIDHRSRDNAIIWRAISTPNSRLDIIARLPLHMATSSLMGWLNGRRIDI